MSTRIGLIVTGKCEQKGLKGSLERVFPDVTFEVLDRVESFTTDLVANQVRDAVGTHLQQHSWTSERMRQKVIQRVRERCSFHLLAPMVEAYFFAEPAALVRAGAVRAAVLDAAVDLEDFTTHDPGFLGQPVVPHKQRPKRKSWAIEHPARAKHPKHYLRFLCDPTNPLTERYSETLGGSEALKALDWSRVFSRAEHARLARSLFEDIAHLLGVNHPFPGQSHPATASFKLARVLRNL